MNVLIWSLLAIALAITLAIMVIFLGRQILFASTMLHGPVFVPSSDEKLDTMLKLADPEPSANIIDLGSGDGKVVFALAERYPEIEIEGIEINPLLVRRARIAAEERGLADRVSFTRGSFWDLDFGQYDLILLYGTSYIMEKLEQRLRAEMKPGARIVSNYFQFPQWEATRVMDDVREYTRTV